MDCKVSLSGIRLYGYHGVAEQERKIGNWFEYSVELHYDATGAAESDDIAEALNYAEVAETVRRESAIPSRLLEHVAGRIRKALLTQFPQATAGSVTVIKLHPPIGLPAPAAVTLTW